MRKFFNRKKPQLESSPASPATSAPTTPLVNSVRDRVNIFEQQSALGFQIPLDNPSSSSNRIKPSQFPTLPQPTDLPATTSNENPNNSRDKRQVAFVSPPISLNRPPSPPAPAPVPSLPSHRVPAAAPKSTNNGSFHHPPASVSSPTPRNVWRSEGPAGGSNTGSHHGHHQVEERGGPASINDSQRATSPLSFLSSSIYAKRSSAGAATVGPADTWGGNIIGGRLGEDIYQPMTWSEMTDLDLVENLSGRERTRQEVLWEIVASEERYVSELVSLRNHYITPLLHPLIAPIQQNSPPMALARLNPPYCKSPSLLNPTANSSSPTIVTSTPPNPQNSDFLPIAARFISIRSSSPSSNVSLSNQSRDNIPDIESEDLNHQTPLTTPDRAPTSLEELKASNKTAEKKSVTKLGAGATQKSSGSVEQAQESKPNVLTRSSTSPHQQTSNNNYNTLRGLRHYLRPPIAHNKLHKISSSGAQQSSSFQDTSNTGLDFFLPESLKIVFNIIDEGMFRGHEDLSVKLKAKYLEQFPLVRDLTSVWAEQSWIIQIYSIYVMHLERALRDIEEALAASNPKNSGITKSQKKFAKMIMQLEENAAQQGECGLAICLSKPFQRLLKYPLLFQNLLYHTDASTHEYESAQAMAISIDSIVRSIEDEKISEEERDKARDVWSRIEGINEKVLMVPSSDRLLMSEESVWKPVPGKEKRTLSDAAEAGRPSSSSTTPTPPDAQPQQLGSNYSSKKGEYKSTSDRLRLLKGQKSFRRLSDMIGSESKEPAMGSKRDIWLIIFSDVILRCQRTGVTRMSTSGFSSASKKKMKRSMPGRERNLYKFLKIERWEKHSSIVLSEANRRLEEAAGGSSVQELGMPIPSQHNQQQPQQQQQEQSEVKVRVQLADVGDSLRNGSNGSDSGTGEYERMRRESEMSFCYESDDPRPLNANVLKAMTNIFKGPPAGQVGSNPNGGAVTVHNNRLLSPTIHSVINKRTNAVTKFSNRVPSPGTFSPCASPPLLIRSLGAPNPTMPSAQYRYETPTTSTLAKKMQTTTGHLSKLQQTPTNGHRQGAMTNSARRRGGSISCQDVGSVGGTNGLRRRSDSTGPASPPLTINHNNDNNKPKTSENPVTCGKRNFINNAAGREGASGGLLHSPSSERERISKKQPSEDFSAFKSYFSDQASNMVGSSRVLAFPSS